MMKKLILGFICLSLISPQAFAAGLKFNPITHASMVIEADNQTIYVDPVGNISEYDSYSKPDLILITHTHGDHFDPELVKSQLQPNTIVIAPRSVINGLGFGQVLNNSEVKTFGMISIEAVAMYNTTKDRMKFHKKGQGNGYIITISGKKIYISGDTEDIPEIRKLQNIDHAFICMNLPFTMTVEQAASAVLDFQPKFVYPYHYRGQDGFSDIRRFKKLISENKDINVVFLKWYE